MITSVNLFSGLAGFYIIEDAEVETRLGLPQDKYDIPLALSSKQYTSTGNLTSVGNETGSVYGDVIEVNGQPWPFLSVEPRRYRLRILNTALSRTFNLTILDNSSGSALPLQVVASDSGFMSVPITTTELIVAEAERWEVIIDFSGNDEWVINGVSFTDVKNRVLAAPQRGATEIWVLENHNSHWSHPIHIHLVDFQIISRSNGRNSVESYEKVALKDVAVLGPKETVTIAVTFAPFAGLYMFHCHNAIHEDHAMMDAFNITAIQGLGYNASDLMFADPLDASWRAKNYTDSAAQSSVDDILAAFAATKAYANVSTQVTQNSGSGLAKFQSATLCMTSLLLYTLL
ncbi:hypothetical protein ACHAQJ_007683 [Trichoderma viride]